MGTIGEEAEPTCAELGCFEKGAMMDLMVEIKIWRWRGGRRWRWSKTFPFLEKRDYNVLMHKTFTAGDQRQRVRFDAGGLRTDEGRLSLLGYDFAPRVIGTGQGGPDVDGNQQPL